MTDAAGEQQGFYPKRMLLLFLLFPLLGVLAAILTVLADDAAQNASPQAVGQPQPAVVQDDLAPLFELPRLDGGTLRLTDLRGRVVFVNFWATWCGPCRREMPAFEAFLGEQGPRGATIVAIDDAESPEQIQAFFDEIAVENIPTVIDADRIARREYGVFNLPTTFIVAPDGTIAALHFGEITLDDLHRFANEFGV